MTGAVSGVSFPSFGWV